MFLSCLRFAVFIAIMVSYTVAAASPNPLKGTTNTKASSLWQGMVKKALPIATLATLLFAPLPLDALPTSKSVPQLQTPKRDVRGEDYVGRAIFFEHEGVGKRGIVMASDGYKAQVTFTTGPAANGQELFETVMLSVEQIEAALNWDYDVSGNFVAFVPEVTHGLDTQWVSVPSRIGISARGQLEIDLDYVEGKEVALGTIIAVADDGRYLIKPYHFSPFAYDPHDWEGTKADDHREHREGSPSLLQVKHFHNLNTGLHLVSEENVVSGLERIMLEETEISEPFFSYLTNDDRVLDTEYAEDFVGELIYYRDAEGRRYLAHAIGQQDNKLVVRLPGGNSTKLIEVEQIMAMSMLDGNGKLGNSISFLGFNAFPLYHSVRWRGHRLPGARGGIWEEKVMNGSLVALLNNGLMVAKVVETSINGLYANYVLYLVYHGDGVIHFGNHHHRQNRQ